MPYHEPDETDPMTLHGVELEVEGLSAVREMARCFIEEFARLGHGADGIGRLFASGEFSGPALAVRELGVEEIELMIVEHFDRRGSRGARTHVEMSPVSGVSLPVL